MSEQQLKDGLEWVYRRTKITIILQRSYLDVTIYPDFPHGRQRIRLELRVSGENAVYVNDLTGNGYASGIQGAGYGTLAFNLGVLALHEYFGLRVGDPAAAAIKIGGKISAVGDPAEPVARESCREGRARFWSGRGFVLADPNAFYTSMSATLADMRLKSEGFTANGTPLGVSLDNFWPLSCRPLLVSHDIEAVMAIDLKDVNPMLSDLRPLINVAKSAAEGWSASFFWMAFLALLAIGVNLLFLMMPPRIALFGSLGMAFGCFYLASSIETKIRPLVPRYRTYWSLRSVYSDTRASAEVLIREAEDGYGGLIWRLHEGLAKLDERFDCDDAKMLAEASRQGNTSYLVERFDQYILYLQGAKRAVKDHLQLPHNAS